MLLLNFIKHCRRLLCVLVMISKKTSLQIQRCIFFLSDLNPDFFQNLVKVTTGLVSYFLRNFLYIVLLTLNFLFKALLKLHSLVTALLTLKSLATMFLTLNFLDTVFLTFYFLNTVFLTLYFLDTVFLTLDSLNKAVLIS